MAPPGRYYGGTLQYLLGHPVRRRPSSNSRWIRRPATPSSMSARQPGRRRRRPPSIISRSRLQRKGPASGLFLIYCRDAAHSTPHLFAAVQVRYQGIGPVNGPVAASTESAPLRLRHQLDVNRRLFSTPWLEECANSPSSRLWIDLVR